MVIGIDDKTGEIKGVDGDILFQTMDSISNAVSDSCEPQIVPSIEPYTVDGKTVIIVTVAPEPHRPYYLKSKGKEHGTYIRVAATSRIATPDKIRELEFEGEKISWDELTCVGYRVTGNAIRKLCHDINKYRKEMQERRESFAKLPNATRVNLENWHVLKKSGDGYLASNAFVLLAGEHFRYSKTQCAVFAGKERGEFIDKQDYTGPLYEQIENDNETSVEYRQSIGEASVKHRRNIGDIQLNATQHKIVKCLSEKNTLTGAALADIIGISKRNIETNVRKLKDMGVLIRHGSQRSGYWEVRNGTEI